MADDFGIDLNLKNLASRPGVNRVTPQSTPSPAEKPVKSLGDLPPPKADLKDYPEELRELFTYAGILQMLARKLNALTGMKYDLVPAEGERVSIDPDGHVYVGMAFVAENLFNEPLLAGVLAHEWGHFPTRRKPQNLDVLAWEEIYRLRREEETKADIFCGRALFLLGYRFEPLIAYLRKHEDPQQKSAKYHTVESRARVIGSSWISQSKRNDLAGNLKLTDAVYGDPVHTTRLIGS
jgi:hypothetical protein